MSDAREGLLRLRAEIGKAVVGAGVEWLRRAGARTIGLETMPRTMDNIGFYSTLGFVPGRLTLTVTLDAAPHGAPLGGPPGRAASPDTSALLGRLPQRAREGALAECAALAGALASAAERAVKRCR